MERRFLTKLHWSLAINNMRKFEIVIVNSTFARSSLISCGVEPSRIRVIPNGIHEDLLQHSTSAVRENQIICYANFFPIKGQHLLIRAFAASGLAKDHTLLCVGGGDEDYRSACLALINSLGLGGSVDIRGPPSRRELFQMIQRAKISVFPSMFESFGIGILESMALGTPVIATMFGGPPDFITNGREGFLTDPFNTALFAEHLVKLCNDVVLRDSLKANARLKAEQLTWNKIAPMYVSLYTCS